MKEAAYVTAFKSYIKSTAGADRDLIEAEFYGESDRACGILQASWVELSLEEAIKHCLQPRSSRFFDYPEALSSFSAKAHFAYEIKLFGIKTRHDLDLIRLLRNGFAHSMVPLRFSDEHVAQICNNFSLLNTSSKVIPTRIMDLEEDPNTPRNRYIICSYTIIKHLLDYRWSKTPEDLLISLLP